jgi:hypothetical protein
MSTISGIVNATSSPPPIGDNLPNTQNRVGKFSETYVLNEVPTKHMAALSGKYYTAVNAGVAAVTSLTALTEASPVLIIENTYAGAGIGPNILLDYVRIRSTAVMAAAVDWQFGWKLDNVRQKWGSAGSAPVPVNANMGIATASFAQINFGALVVVTAKQSSANARLVQDDFLACTGTAPVMVIGDVTEFRFGSLESGMVNTSDDAALTTGAHLHPLCYPVSMGPIVLPPGTTATLFLWGTTGGSAPSYSLNMGWYEY